MPIDPITTGILGAAAGWAGQWFVIDKPIYRKLDGGSAVAVKTPDLSADWQAKLDACGTKCKDLEAKLAAETEANAHLKVELGEANAAFESAKKELAGLRAVSGQAEDVRDDLEEIDGIGPVFERKLYDAGVFTFAQLAATSPDKIREIIKPQNWQKIEPEKWIAESAEFAKRGK